ncbi:hypothetical protein QVD17_08642 [Tagetes erecta]|uniref:Uncharacterized protein n=1 Tax=Tagetes erecta TaxID=13708 RepID=A0AAD8KY64_TARER|nr:hypothetical protein QVD17_08642 [Tagetes erecta]
MHACNIPARRTMILSALAAETPSGAAPHGFKTRHGRGGYHTLIKQCLVLLPTDVGSYNPPPLEDQRPRWHIGRRLALIPLVTSGPSYHQYCPLCYIRAHGFAFGCPGEAFPGWSPILRLLSSEHA